MVILMRVLSPTCIKDREKCSGQSHKRPIYFFEFDLCALKRKFLDMSRMVLEIIRNKGDIMPLSIIT